MTARGTATFEATVGSLADRERPGYARSVAPSWATRVAMLPAGLGPKSPAR